MTDIFGLAVSMSDCKVIEPVQSLVSPRFFRQGTLLPTVSKWCLVKNGRNFQVIGSWQEGHPAVKFQHAVSLCGFPLWQPLISSKRRKGKKKKRKKKKTMMMKKKKKKEKKKKRRYTRSQKLVSC